MQLIENGKDIQDKNPKFSNSKAFGEAIAETPVSLILMVMFILSYWFVGGLCGYHTYLVSTN